MLQQYNIESISLNFLSKNVNGLKMIQCLQVTVNQSSAFDETIFISEICFLNFVQIKYHRIIKQQVNSNVSSMNEKIQYKQTQVDSNSNKFIKKKANKANSLDYRGMTLKDYFRLSQNGPSPDINEIKETQQQNACQSKEATTPCFADFQGRQKIKTQIYQDKSFIEDKPSFIQKQINKQIFTFQNKTKQLKVQKLPIQLRSKKDNKNNKNKRAATLGNHLKNHLNRSTITSFYQIQDKQKRMLEKVRYEKERVNQMKLSDAFFITKYAFKFKINHPNAL